MPLASNSVMVHNEHHTMSMLVVFLQVREITLCQNTALLNALQPYLRQLAMSSVKIVYISPAAGHNLAGEILLTGGGGTWNLSDWGIGGVWLLLYWNIG